MNAGGEMQVASYVVVDRKTGRALCEIPANHRDSLVERLSADLYEVVPILDWLYRVNATAQGVN